MKNKNKQEIEIKKISIKNFIIPAIIIAFGLIISIPFFKMMDIKTIDDSTFKFAIYGLKLNMTQIHQFPYRINEGIFYGIQQPIFYHFTYLYTVFIFNLIFGLSDVVSYNLTLILINIFTASSMYITVKSIYKNKYIALLSAMLYSFCVYRLSNLYNRGALGETISFMFIPIYILLIYKIFIENVENDNFDDKKNRKVLYAFLIITSLILQDHTLTTYLYFIGTIILLIIFYIMNRKIPNYKNRYKFFIKCSIFSFLLNTWYIFPIIYESLFVNYINPAFYLGQSQFSIPSVISDLICLFPDYTSQNIIGVSFNILAVVSVVCMILIFVKKVELKLIDKFSIILIIIGLVFYILCFDFVSFDLIRSTFLKKFIDVLQFRYRFFLITIPFFSIACPYLIMKFLNNKIVKGVIVTLLVLTACISTATYIKNVLKNATFQEKQSLSWPLDYCLPNTLPTHSFDYNNELIISDENIVVTNQEKNIDYLSIDYELKQKTNKDMFIDFPFFNYPVYKVYDENKKVLTKENGVNDLIRIHLKKNKGKVIIKYEEPLFWVFGTLISMCFVIVMLCKELISAIFVDINK